METENDASNNNGRDAEVRPRKKDINIYMSVDSKRRVKGTWVCGYAGSGRATNPARGIGGKNPASPLQASDLWGLAVRLPLIRSQETN